MFLLAFRSWTAAFYEIFKRLSETSVMFLISKFFARSTEEKLRTTLRLLRIVCIQYIYKAPIWSLSLSLDEPKKY